MWARSGVARFQPKKAAPTAPGASGFDEETYLLLHPDVAAAVRAGQFRSGYEHWVVRGEREGRLVRLNKSRPELPADFDEASYLARYPDVADLLARGVFRNGYEHWVHTGAAEGRLTRDAVSRPAVDGFDEDAYLHFNPDVARALRDGLFRSAHEHWLRYGKDEGRGGAPVPELPSRAASIATLEERPFGVNFYGFLEAVSGLGTMARGCMQALQAAALPAQAIAVPSWKPGEKPAPAASPADFRPYRANLLQQNPDILDLFAQRYGTELLNGAYNIGYWIWELPSARSDWHPQFRYVDEIWVASEFNRQSFQCLTKLPVVTVPLPVDGLEANAIYGRERFGLPADVFVFCYIFDVSSYVERKNPFALVEAFQREFRNSTDVLLYLKYSNSKADRDALQRLEQAIAGAPNIRTSGRLLDEQEIVSLHKVIDCTVSPHRSEGFGLNLAETMYFGNAVIATGYSGNLEFMNRENSYLIDWKPIPVQRSEGPYLKWSMWADPSIEHLQSLMRRVFENSEERRARSARARGDIRRQLSFEAVGSVMKHRLEALGLHREHVPAPLYRTHSVSRERLFPASTPRHIAEAVRGWEKKPLISVLVPVYNVSPVYLGKCIDSVRAQHYPFWELCICDDASTDQETVRVLDELRGTDPRIKIVRLEHNSGIAPATNRAAEISTGEYLALLDNDDELAPAALLEVARAVNANPSIDFLYTDEDKLESDGRHTEEYFKPDWSPEHLQSVMYILHLLVIRKDLFCEVGGFRAEYSGAQDYDLALRATARAKAIHHIPQVLYHWRKIEGSAAAAVDAKPAALDAGRRALADFVHSRDPLARVEPGRLPGHFRVRYSSPDNPLASLLIITGDRWATVYGRGRINLVENFVRSIAAKTSYPNYEIVLVDDGELSPRTRDALEGIPFRVVSYTGSPDRFHFSKKANFAFGQARGEHLVLLNDDLEVITPEWLTALLEWSAQPEIAVCGARLLYPDDRIQHAGMVAGIHGGAAHVFHGLPAADPGYYGFAQIIRNYSCVTGACFAARRAFIEKLGGFDEQFAIDYNDVDFCLRAVDRGYRVVYTPFAELYHFEGVSIRRKAQDPAEVELFRKRWAKFIGHDPYYNPNLTREALDFTPRRAVRQAVAAR